MSKEKVNDLLIKKAEQIRTGAEAIVAVTNDWQTIKEYMCNRLSLESLTDVQKDKMDRYSFMYSQLLSGKYSKQDVIQMTMKLFKKTITVIYEDYACMTELYNSVIHFNRLFEIKMELETAQRLLRKCEEERDYKAAAAIQKNIITLKLSLPEETETPGELFRGHTVEVANDPRLLGAPEVDLTELLSAINAKRKVKIDTTKFEVLNEIKDGSSKEALQ